jgi:hypothetical protein
LSLASVVASAVVSLEQLVGRDLVDESQLGFSELTLDEILGAPLSDVRELVEQGLIGVEELEREAIDLQALVDARVVTLQELADQGLVTAESLPLDELSLEQITSGLSGGAPTRLSLNDGTGRFLAPVSIDTGVTTGLAVADVNADAVPDLVIGGFGTPTKLFYGTGAGFDAGHEIALSPSTDVELADVSGDGLPDLVIANTGAQSQVYVNRGELLDASGVQAAIALARTGANPNHLPDGVAIDFQYAGHAVHVEIDPFTVPVNATAADLRAWVQSEIDAVIDALPGHDDGEVAVRLGAGGELLLAQKDQFGPPTSLAACRS